MAEDDPKVLTKLSRFTERELSSLSQIIARRILEKRYPPIRKLELFLTGDCNLRCDYCFVREKVPTYMSWEVAKESVNLLFLESRNIEDMTIIFFGGEPLLLWELIEKVVCYAESMGKKFKKKLHFSLTTNGVLLSEKILEFSQRHKIMHLLSIDGDKETHNLHRKFPDGKGTYDLVVSKIPTLKMFQGWLGARMTVTPETVNRLAKNVKFLYGLGINQFIIGADQDIPWDNTALDEYKKAVAICS